MSYVTRRSVLAAAVVALGWPAPAPAQPITFTGSYTQNFDSMGPTGTAPPAGWQVLSVTGGSGTWINTTGSNSTPAVGAIPNGTAVAGGTASTGLVVNDNPTGNDINGFNAIGATLASTDRAIATAPTQVAGNVIQLELTNSTGLAIGALRVGYTIRSYQVGADNTGRTPGAGIPEGSEELPGYWLFYSLDNGANFTAVDSLIPVGEGPSSNPVIPNATGNFVIPPGAGFGLVGGTWNPGQNLVLRWVDDNAIDPSPDQIIGLDNVSVGVVPEPSSLLSLSAVALAAGGRAVRRRFGTAKAA